MEFSDNPVNLFVVDKNSRMSGLIDQAMDDFDYLCHEVLSEQERKLSADLPGEDGDFVAIIDGVPYQFLVDTAGDYSVYPAIAA